MMPAPSEDNVPARPRRGNGATSHPTTAPPAEAWPDTPDLEAPARAAPALTPVEEALEALVQEWEHPTRPTPTGLRQLDALLHGGLRPGDMLGVTGPAAGGKSALTGQLALDLAKAGAAVIYASVEMPATELAARWLALEAFRAVPADAATPWAIDYASVLYGATYRGEGLPGPAAQAAALARLDAARRAVAAVGAHLYAQQVAPGTTVAQLRSLVAAARARDAARGAARPVVLIVDPLQRLFASQGERSPRVTDALNASETERVGAVAQELKFLADTEALAVVFTSDTTKAAATGVVSSAGALRGSYQINHLATAVFGLFTAPDAAALRARLHDVKDGEPVAPELREADIEARALPAWWHARADVARLGGRVAVLECSKNRRGRPRALALGFVPGAACFVENHGPDRSPR
jgi:hypothetical protein